jgi:hypothetical protein
MAAMHTTHIDLDPCGVLPDDVDRRDHALTAATPSMIQAAC